MALDPWGLTIFLIGIALLVLELAQPGYFIGVPGTVGVIVGGIQMFWPELLKGNIITAFVVVPVVAGVATWGSIVFYKRFAPAVAPPETLSSDAFIGKTGHVVFRVEPNNMKGKVKVGSIVWSATSDTEIAPGEPIRVRKVDGVHLIVEPDATPPQKT